MSSKIYKFIIIAIWFMLNWFYCFTSAIVASIEADPRYQQVVAKVMALCTKIMHKVNKVSAAAQQIDLLTPIKNAHLDLRPESDPYW